MEMARDKVAFLNLHHPEPIIVLQLPVIPHQEKSEQKKEEKNTLNISSWDVGSLRPMILLRALCIV